MAHSVVANTFDACDLTETTLLESTLAVRIFTLKVWSLVPVAGRHTSSSAAGIVHTRSDLIG
jgi:hypothetical protein